MGKKLIAINEYIANAEPFAQPILIMFRDLVHELCPECEEKVKWGMPHFEYKGQMISTASFKEHCILNFWKAPLLDDPRSVLEKGTTSAMGQLGRIKSMADLSSKSVLAELILNEADIKSPKKPTRDSIEIDVPADFQLALDANKQAETNFNGFPPGQRKEYLEWITGAKREGTRAKRILTSIEWLAEGKRKNWKYEKC
jgi:uncharacterized protein YdeI (YjbR/CyaY-like superfamily)